MNRSPRRRHQKFFKDILIALGLMALLILASGRFADGAVDTDGHVHLTAEFQPAPADISHARWWVAPAGPFVSIRILIAEIPVQPGDTESHCVFVANFYHWRFGVELVDLAGNVSAMSPPSEVVYIALEGEILFPAVCPVCAAAREER